MTTADISVVLAVHREGALLHRTWASLVEAARFARAAGVSCEVVTVLDRADAETQAAWRACTSPVFTEITTIEADNGSLGPTRNMGIAAATGRLIATADADDLISYNYLLAMAEMADRLGPDAILVPKFVFAFGATYHVAEYFDLDDVTPLVLLMDHPFVSRIFFHRALSSRLVYADTGLHKKKYVYEDWHFNCEAVALGCDIRAVPDTILFYRQRANSLKDLSSSRQIPPSRLFHPAQFRRTCKPYVERLRQGDYRASVRRIGREILSSGVALELTAAANAIDPAVDPNLFAGSDFFDYLAVPLALPLAYYRLCRVVGQTQINEVFLLPYLTTGGADRYILSIMQELVRINPNTRILVVFGHAFEHYAWLDQLPPGTIHIDIMQSCPDVSPELRDLLVYKLLQACAPGARLHLKSSEFTQRFLGRFKQVLSVRETVYYRFSDGRNRYGDLTLIEPSPFHFISEHFEHLNLIVCDNATTAELDRSRLAIMPEKWHVLPSRISLPPPSRKRESEGRLNRILWVSRIDDEKRPTLLIEIARLLRDRLPHLTLEVYGKPTLGSFDVKQFAQLPNINYHGEFEHFEDLRAGEHFCFLYTSSFDGIPVVLLEVIAAGLAVIAPDVGAIPEIIRDHETGLLIKCIGDDRIDAERYLSAIEEFVRSPGLRDQFVKAAWTLISERHSPASHASKVAEIFGLPAPASLAHHVAADS